MKELLKRRFELSAKMRWLKTISKATDKYRKIEARLHRQLYVLSDLLKEYKKIYGEDLRNTEKGGE